MKPLSPKDPKEIGGFTLVGRLGAGGMGVVYLASRKSDSVALKVIRESLIDDEVEAARFTREVVTLEKIQSPNVAEIIEAGVDDGRAWFAVEFINGPNLSELVDDKGPLPLEKWWELAAGVLRGLADVHRMGIIHRDVKPANVIMAESGPKLIDFGIAHVSDATSVTATGLVAGSPAWFSPEQIEGLELTTATDVFSAGSLLIFAATGSSPWGGATTMTKASVFKILTSEPDMGGLDTEQRNLVSKMLEKEPSQRATAEALLENLDAVRAGKKVELKTASAAPKPKGSDATTTVERASLNQSVRAAFSSRSSKTATGAQSVIAAGTKNKKKNWIALGAVVAVAALGISFLVSNSSASGAVSVSRIVSDGNRAIGDYGLRLSSASVEPVSIDLAKQTQPGLRIFSWRTGEPLRVSYTPPFSEDEAYEGTVLPSELGLNGFDDGTKLFIHVSLEELSTLLSFRTVADRAANEVYAIRLVRGDESRAVDACVNETEPEVQKAMEAHQNLHRSFKQSEEAARLGVQQRLIYSTWASRFTDLNIRLTNNREVANLGYSAFDPSLSAVQRVNQASIDLEQAAANHAALSEGFAYGSGNPPEDEWDGVWQAYYAADDELASAVRSLSVSDVAEANCRARIE